MSLFEVLGKTFQLYDGLRTQPLLTPPTHVDQSSFRGEETDPTTGSVSREAPSCLRCSSTRTNSHNCSGCVLLHCDFCKAAWPGTSFSPTLKFKGTKHFKSSLKYSVFCLFSLSSGVEIGQSHSHKNTITEDRHTFLSYMKTARSGPMLRHCGHLFTQD